MKKVFFPIVVLLVCAFIITGCSSGASPTATTPAATSPTVTSPSTTVPSTSPDPTTVPVVTTTPSGVPDDTSKYGGVVRRIEAVAPGSPIGATWETPFIVPATQLSLEAMLKEMVDGSLQPLLATSYEIDSQEPSITFHLRKGVKFHDGTDFNAQAVKFTWDKVKDSGYFGGTRFWVSIDVIDDYTVKVMFTMHRNSSITAFAQNQCFVVSPTAFEKNGLDWIRWNMVGTGAFAQSEFRRDVSLSAIKNTNYWNSGKPYLDEVSYLYVSDELTRIALFKSGGAEILNTNGSGRVASEMEASGYKIVTQLTGAAVLMPDGANADSPWANQKVREAAEYAIDKEAIARTFGYGYWEAAYQLPNQNSPAYIKDLDGRKYDVAKAKQILTEAGYPNGFKTKIIAQNTVNKDIIVAVQSFLARIGIQCDLEFPEPARFNEYTSGTWKNALLYTTVNQMANFNVTYGFSFASPQSLHRSIKQPENYAEMYTATMTSGEVVPELQQRIVQAFYDNVSFIPIFYSADMWAMTNNVYDTGHGSRGSTAWWNAEETWLKK